MVKRHEAEQEQREAEQKIIELLADLRAGVIATVIAQVHSEKGKAKRFKPSLFFPSLNEPTSSPEMNQDIPGADAFRMYLTMYSKKWEREHGESSSNTDS